jgi:hypothetical protein
MVVSRVVPRVHARRALRFVLVGRLFDYGSRTTFNPIAQVRVVVKVVRRTNVLCARIRGPIL